MRRNLSMLVTDSHFISQDAHSAVNAGAGIKHSSFLLHSSLHHGAAAIVGTTCLAGRQEEKAPCSRMGLVHYGAQKKTRTSTFLRTPAPEAGASTNFAIWAVTVM